MIGVLVGKVMSREELLNYMVERGYNGDKTKTLSYCEELIFENKDMSILIEVETQGDKVKILGVQIEEYLKGNTNKRLSREEVAKLISELKEKYPKHLFRANYDSYDKMYTVFTNLDTFNDDEFNEWCGNKMFEFYQKNRRFNVLFVNDKINGGKIW